MRSERLAVLKDELIRATDFSQVSAMFLDDLANDPAFLNEGDFVRSDFLEGVLAEIGRQVLGRKARLENVILTRIPKKRFVHGFLTINGRPGTLIFFEDGGIGLVTLLLNEATGRTHYVRFTGHLMPDGWSPDHN